MFSAYLAALTLTCSNLHSPSSFRKHLVGCLLLPRQTTDPKFTLHTCAYTCHNCVMICLSTRIQFSCSVMSNPASPWNAAGQALSITNSQSLLKLLSIEWVMPSNHLISTMLSPFAFNLSQHQGIFFLSGGYKYWSFQLQHQSFQ